MLTFGDVINMKGQSDEYILQVLAANYPSLDDQNVPARKLRKMEQLRKKTSFGLQTKYLNRKWVWNVVLPAVLGVLNPEHHRHCLVKEVFGIVAT